MDRSKKALEALILILLMGVSVAASAAEYVPGEVLVKYKQGVTRTRDTMDQLYDAAGVAEVKHYSNIMKGLEQLILQENVKVPDAIAALNHSDLVEYAQPDYIIHALPTESMETPTAPSGGFHIDMPCIFPGIPWPPGCGKTSPAKRPALLPAPADVVPPVPDPDLDKDYGLKKIGAIQAWSTFRGSRKMVVADIDTGIDYNHEDLAFNVWRNPHPTQNDVVGFDFVHNDGLPYDDNSHGTHTAGTIGAVGGNGKGTSGVAQRVSIMAVKFLDADGGGTTSDAIRAIDYAVEHGARILSNSWGGQGGGNNKALQDAITRAQQKGVLFVVAAGNDGADNDGPEASYPAAFNNDNIISVAATDQKDNLAYFSNFGANTTDLGAPGVKIYSTVPGNKYKAESGTSMACPHVAGAAALIWAAKPTLDYKQVKKILLESVDPVPSLEGKTVTGGRLDVAKALQMVRSME